MGNTTKIIIVIFIVYLIYKEYIESKTEVFLGNNDVEKYEAVKQVANYCYSSGCCRLPDTSINKVYINGQIRRRF